MSILKFGCGSLAFPGRLARHRERQDRVLAVGVLVGVFVGVFVGVAVGTGVFVGVAVGAGVFVGVSVGVAVASAGCVSAKGDRLLIWPQMIPLTVSLATVTSPQLTPSKCNSAKSAGAAKSPGL